MMVRLDICHGFDDWCDQARDLLRHRIAPGEVDWGRDGSRSQADVPGGGEIFGRINRSLYMPERFVGLARQLLQEGGAGPFALAYRILWRLQSDYGLLDKADDPDVARANDMILVQTLVTRRQGASYPYRQRA